MSEFVIVKNDFPRKAVELKVRSAAIEAETARAVLVRQKARAPKRTGTLARSGRAVGGTITFSARYSGYVDHGTHYMAAEPFFEVELRAAKPLFELKLAAVLNA